MSLKKSLLGVFASLLTVVVLIVYIVFYSYNYDRDMGNQERISKAIVDFYSKKNQLPDSIPDLVNAGYLPVDGFFYKEPPRPLTLFVKFTDSCYIINPRGWPRNVLGRVTPNGIAFEASINARIFTDISAINNSKN